MKDWLNYSFTHYVNLSLFSLTSTRGGVVRVCEWQVNYSWIYYVYLSVLHNSTPTFPLRWGSSRLRRANTWTKIHNPRNFGLCRSSLLQLSRVCCRGDSTPPTRKDSLYWLYWLRLTTHYPRLREIIAAYGRYLLHTCGTSTHESSALQPCTLRAPPSPTDLALRVKVHRLKSRHH